MTRVFIIGLPRSGTTWVAKTFDSHPEVLYRHEPDSVIANPQLPQFPAPGEVERFRDEARVYVDRLFDVATVKTSGARPWFEKAYRSRGAEMLRGTLCAGLRAAEAVPRLQRFARRCPVPDFLGQREASAIVPVVKSVIAAGRADLYAAACPEVRFLFVLRHPCGFVASQLRGKELGLMTSKMPVKTMARTPQAAARGLTEDAFRKMTPEQVIAWYWVIANERMFAETNDRPNVLGFSYDGACQDPLAHFSRAFAHAGLPLGDETRRFLTDVVEKAPDRRERYFSLLRNPAESSTKWREELTPAQIDAVLEVAGTSEVFQTHFDGAPAATA